MAINSLLIYYGYLNSFNSATLQWNNEKVAQEFARYNMLVFGDGVASPTHPDYANASIIIPRVKALNPSTLIFGYVSANQTLNDFQSKTDDWNTLGVHGIFVDEAGYDYGVTRSQLNDRITHIRSKSSANLSFVNAWNVNHVVGVTNDPSYPNATFNPNGYQSLLDRRDWYLLESFVVNTAVYAGNYATQNDWLVRGASACQARLDYGIKLASVNIINDDNADGLTMSNFAYFCSMAFATNAYGTSNTNYGTSGAVKYWKRPSGVIDVAGSQPIVLQDGINANNMVRYGKTAKLVITYSTKVIAILSFNNL